ncbi:MAG: DUF1080 domain-containing protein [Verrucomicrobiota bacterium]
MLSIPRNLFLLFLFPSLLIAGETWHTLFDGSSLSGWKSNDEIPAVFSITEAGELKVSGGRAHLFWMGNDAVPADLKNFDIKMKVKTTAGSNSGFFLHTKYQESGWPDYGVEAQVNTTHKDKRKTGSIYAIQDILNDAPSTDDQWFEYRIRVEGKQVTVYIDGKVVNEYTEPTPPAPPSKRPNVRLSEGTFAIQGHDPKSTVFYKDIKVRLLD